MSEISKWCSKINMTFKTGGNKSIKQWFARGCCEYGMKYFCDGRVNLSYCKKGERLEEKERCKYFVGGKCIKREN